MPQRRIRRGRNPPMDNPPYESWKVCRIFRMIEIKCTADGDPLEFAVIVRNGASETRHQVTIARALCQRFCAGKHTREQCIDAAFRFLLDREPKEAILRRFDVKVISRYFPEFERELPHYLEAKQM